MQFIDTHSHLYLSQFDDDISTCIQRAKEQGVCKIILPNIDSGSISVNRQLSDKYGDICHSLMGLHPTSVKQNVDQEWGLIEKELEKNKYLGIGEIGIDLYWDKTFIEEQKMVFKTQVKLAIANELPFVVHARESHNEIMEVLREINCKSFTGIFHAFMGSVEEACQAIEMGFKLGIGGVVTFKNAKLPEVVKQIDLNHLVLETDSPYLAPTPFRGKRNESSYIPHIAQKIADIQGVGIEQVAETTTFNAKHIFKL